MPNFKITLIEQGTSRVVSEVVQMSYWPQVQYPNHSMQCGAYGTPVKVELSLDVSSEDSFDHTAQR